MKDEILQKRWLTINYLHHDANEKETKCNIAENVKSCSPLNCTIKV